MALTTRARILIGVAAAIIGYLLFNDGKEAATVQPSTRTGAVNVTTSRERDKPAPEARLAHALYLLSNRVSGGGGAEALFAAHSWYVAPPPPPPQPVASVAPAAPAIPTAPPLPYTFMGTFTPDGQTPVFFLTRGDRVYDVRIGDILDDTYSVDSFGDGQLVLTYKPLNIQQQLSAGGGS